jgi:hypothetical protein
VVGRTISIMGLCCALAGILLGSGPGEAFGSTFQQQSTINERSSILRPVDPTNSTLTRTQHPAIVGKAGNGKPFVYAVFACPCNTQQSLTAHS